jgi:hypothetical protein
VNYSLTGSTLTIIIDFSKVPTKLRTNALTLVLDADQDIANLTVRGAQNYTYKGTGPNKIINLQWGTTNTLKSAEIGAIDIKPMLEVTNQPTGFSVFPNPFTNKISVHPGQQLDGKTTFQLVDLSGKTVFGTTIVEPVDNSQIDLKVGETDLQQGVYFLRISNGNATIPTVKLLKIKN